jgi:uncharacterized protein YycO
MAIVRLVSGKGFISGAIKWYTDSEFSHVEFVTPLGYLGSQYPGGVECRPFDYAVVQSEEFREYVLPPDRELELMQWAAGQVGKGYDFLAVLALPLHRDWRDQGNWFCSEFVAAAFDKVACPLFAPPTHVRQITPRDVALSPLLLPCPKPSFVTSTLPAGQATVSA